MADVLTAGGAVEIEVGVEVVFTDDDVLAGTEEVFVGVEDDELDVVEVCDLELPVEDLVLEGEED